MIKRRDTPDGLPFRVYQRHGVKVYSIGYKLPDGKWAFRYSCPISDKAKIRETMLKACEEARLMNSGVTSVGATEELIDAYLKWQKELPRTNSSRRADSTLKENERESKNLKKAFGHMLPNEITKTDGYAYLDACVTANRPEKGNKEISLLQVILEYGVRIGRLEVNPLAGIRKNKRVVTKRYVTHDEINLAMDVGRKMGGQRHIVALALKTAWLCVKRSVEVRAIKRDSIQADGVIWSDGKSKTKGSVLIEWSDELKQTIDEALSFKRPNIAGCMYLFGNAKGQKYTKGGWKAMLDDLMRECEKEAERRSIGFEKFSLQDCRPKGVSDKLSAGHTDVQDATNHTSDRMIRQVYDSRLIKKAKPAK